MVDKNRAVIEYLLQCPAIEGSPLYFNFVNARDGSQQVVTTSNDVSINKPYVDGSVSKRYTFTFIQFKSVTDNAIVTSLTVSNENVDEMADAQALIDWVAEQDDKRNFPYFGEGNVVEAIRTTTENPNLDGINTQTSPMLAMYSVSIQVDYLDTTRTVWN